MLCGPNYLPGGLALAAGRPPRTGAAHALPARSVQAALQAAVAVDSQGEDQSQQNNTLDLIEIPGGDLKSLVRRVKSGDPDNVEAQAARRYWHMLFGSDFRRERFGDMPNPLLNYGYTVLRAAVARAVVVRRTPSLPGHPPPQSRQSDVLGGRPDGTVQAVGGLRSRHAW